MVVFKVLDAHELESTQDSNCGDVPAGNADVAISVRKPSKEDRYRAREAQVLDEVKARGLDEKRGVSSRALPSILAEDPALPPELLGSLLASSGRGDEAAMDNVVRVVELEAAEDFASLEQLEERRRKQEVRQNVWARALKLRKAREEKERSSI